MVRKSVDDHKKNILNVINKLTKEELEKVSDMLRAGGEIPEDQLDDEKSNELIVEDIDGDEFALDEA